jgi:hypothetical protein
MALLPTGLSAQVAAEAATPTATDRSLPAHDLLGEDGSGIPSLPMLPTPQRSARGVKFSDLNGKYSWANTAINYVASTNDWMRDFAPTQKKGTPFKPAATETRKYFARAIVKAFDPKSNRSVTFNDMSDGDQFTRWARAAVAMGWMGKTAGGNFSPDQPITMMAAHRALVRAIGLGPVAKHLNKLKTKDDFAFDTPPNFGTTLLGMRLNFRFRSRDSLEGQNVAPTDPLNRAQVAYSLWKAKLTPSYSIDAMKRQYGNMVLPKLGPRLRKVVQWGINYVGYPYIWAGEWGFDDKPNPLRKQVRSGFDCSGISWWVMKRNYGSWKVAPPRPYAGWRLDERSSAYMAAAASKRIAWANKQPGDLLFYASGGGTIDHVDLYIGGGFAIDSSSSPAGVTLMWIGDGWYRDHFKWGRRLIGQ